MKNLLHLSLSLMLLGCATSQETQIHTVSSLYTVSGTITSSSSYCGGVAPTPEQEAYYHQPKPVSCWLYLREGSRNDLRKPIVDSVKTNEQGYCEFRLPKGEYLIISSEQRDEAFIERVAASESDYLSVDKLCLKSWLDRGMFQVNVVDSNITNLDHNYHYRCFVPYALPCLDYNGPYPP